MGGHPKGSEMPRTPDIKSMETRRFGAWFLPFVSFSKDIARKAKAFGAHNSKKINGTSMSRDSIATAGMRPISAHISASVSIEGITRERRTI